jgi:hypothetical protein
MGSPTDFLFEGQPPKSVTTYGQTIKDVPKWMSDYTQGLIARANAAAAEPYIAYEGPRIAGFSPAQQAAFGLTEQNVGSYQPFVEGATQAAMGVAGGPSPLEEAQPYLGAGTGSFAAPGAAEQYMNPYIQNVLNRNESLAGRTLEEQFLPSLQRTFAGAGSYGSRGGEGSMEQIGMRGVRDITEGLNEQNLAALSGAYGQAADIFGQEGTRNIQAGQIAGSAATAGGQLGLGAARELGALGEFSQQAGMMDAASLEAMGQTQQGMDQASLDLAYRDFAEQRDLPMARTGFMSEIIRGLPPSAVPSAQTTTEVGPASIYQPSPLSQVAGGYGVYKALQPELQARGGYIRYAKGGLARMIDLDPSDYRVVSMGKN